MDADALVSLGIVVCVEHNAVDSDSGAFERLWQASASIFVPVFSCLSAVFWLALAHAVVTVPGETSGALLGEADAIVEDWVEVVAGLAWSRERKALASGQVPSFVRCTGFSNALATARVLVEDTSLRSSWSAYCCRAVLVIASAAAEILIPRCSCFACVD